jgi:pimeloyl-ACP methyl ester carboxylesterase
MKKRVIFIIIGLALAVSIPFGVKSIREAHYPIDIQPSAEWEPYLSTLDVQREAFFVDSVGTKLEAELFIPNGGREEKPAVIFSPGSGDSLYQNYGYGLIETFVLDVFLSHDIAVLLVNKRGMGKSGGNYAKNSIEGRAADIYAAMQSIQSHSQIDDMNIGLIGHSQGGWVVTYAAAEYPEVAFFISLAGPTTTMMENSSDNAYHIGRCQGLENVELEAYIEKRLKLVQISISIGKATNFGMFGFDARNMQFDPRSALTTVQSPGLFAYSENDDQVTPSINIDRMNEIFNNDVSENISIKVIDGATHVFRLVNDPCESWENPDEQEQSEQLLDVLHSWLTDQGY